MFYNPTIQEFKDYFFRDFPFGTDPAEKVVDQDIAKAFGQTNMFINQRLFDDNPDYKIGYNLLAAHFLVIDFQMSSQGLGSAFSWIESSKSVGSVSQSFAIPQSIQDDPQYAMLTRTGYGAKYLSLVLPKLVGNVFAVKGKTHA